MSKIIDELIGNPFNQVKKSYYKCPLCSGDLYTSHNFMGNVMGGNTVYYCENDDIHKFWNNYREGNIFHLNKDATETNFDSEQDYELINDILKIK